MDWSFIIGLAILIEFITAFLRFSTGIHSKRVQHKLHLPIRIHHMYFGILIDIVGLFYVTPVVALESSIFIFPLTVSLFEIGFAIALSDLFHHFVVLPAVYKTKKFPIDFP